MTQQLLPEEEESDGEAADEEAEFELDMEFNLPDSGYSTGDFTNGSREIQDLVNMFARESDEILDRPHTFGNQFTPPIQHSAIPSHYNKRLVEAARGMSSNSLRSTTTPPTKLNSAISQPRPQATSPATAAIPSSLAQPNKYRCHCGYEPTGSEEWKASNFARHKRTQHASEAKSYRCSFPGCTAKYRRSDNLKAHLRLKGHGDEDSLFGEFLDMDGAVEGEEEGLGARPSKRRKRGNGKNMGLRSDQVAGEFY